MRCSEPLTSSHSFLAPAYYNFWTNLLELKVLCRTSLLKIDFTRSSLPVIMYWWNNVRASPAEMGSFSDIKGGLTVYIQNRSFFFANLSCWISHIFKQFHPSLFSSLSETSRFLVKSPTFVKWRMLLQIWDKLNMRDYLFLNEAFQW